MPKPEPLDTMIHEYAADQAKAKRLGDRQAARRDRILAALRKRRKAEWTTPKGIRASVVESETSSWKIDQLRKALDSKRFTALCPPAPNAKALKAILVSDPVLGKKLEKCRDVEVNTSLRVEKGKRPPE